MRTFDDCIPCIKRQVEKLSKSVTDDADLQNEILEKCHEEIAKIDMMLPPPYFAKKLHRIIREISGNPDPYKEHKELYNRRAAEIYPDLKRMAADSDDPFRTAALLALAGNVIDFGASDDFDLEKTIDRILGQSLAIDQMEKLKNRVLEANTILYLGDNAGETVFDRVFIEQFPKGKKVVFAVRQSPILNDATPEDAVEAGLDQIAKIITNGDDAPGTILENCSEEFKKEFFDADLVIAKGMGNYESLIERAGRKAFYILLIKCNLVAGHIKGRLGQGVVCEI